MKRTVGRAVQHEGRKKERNRKEKWEKRASTVFPLRCAVSILTDLPYFFETNQDSGLFRSYPINYPLLDNHLSSSFLFSFQHKCISFSLFFVFFSCCLIRLNTCRRQSRLCGNLHLRYSVFKSPCPFMYPEPPDRCLAGVEGSSEKLCRRLMWVGWGGVWPVFTVFTHIVEEPVMKFGMLWWCFLFFFSFRSCFVIHFRQSS